jgi:hypothetical protein
MMKVFSECYKDFVTRINIGEFLPQYGASILDMHFGSAVVIALASLTPPIDWF